VSAVDANAGSDSDDVTNNVGCRIMSASRSATARSFGNWVYTSGFSNSPMLFGEGNGLNNPGTTYDFGALWLQCTLPVSTPSGPSGINSYYWGEGWE